MRVWVLTNEYEPNIIGGLGIVATRLTQTLARQDVDVTLFCKCFAHEVIAEEKKAVQLVRFPRGSGYHSVARQTFQPRAVLRYAEQHGIRPPEVIQVHSLQWAAFAELCRERYGVPLVYTCHSLVATERISSLKTRMTKVQERLLRAADHIVVPSRWQLQQLTEHYPHCKGRSSAIENGVVVRDDAPQAPQYRLLYVGRLNHLKGVAELLRAVALLRHHEPQVQLDVAGSGSQNYTRTLEGMADTLGIADRVRWLGFKRQEEIQTLYEACGAVIVPSRQESFGLVALEALAAGVPLVSTRSGGLAEFVSTEVAEIIPRVTGYAITQAVRRMWRQKERTLKRVEAGKLVAARYEWERMGHRYQELFNTLLEQKRG